MASSHAHSFLVRASERELQRQLNVARAAAAEERIADGDVRRGDRRKEANSYGAAADKVWSVRGEALGIIRNGSNCAVVFQIYQEVGQRGVGEIGMVEEIENIGA